jgi:radical SAM superfamily enzyme YgiQ (UPF0313 family)
MRVAILVVGDSASENERGAGLPYAFGPRRVHASLLDPRMDIEVTVIESRTPDADAIYTEIERFDPDLIGCSAYVWSFPTLVEVARRAKAARPDRLVVFGGPSARPSMFGLAPFVHGASSIDALVLGEGEIAMRDLVNASAKGRGGLGEVAGLALPSGAGFRRTRPRIPVELDSLPSPHRSGLVPRGTMTCLETHRGCPLSCAFCEWGAEKQRIQVHSQAALNRELDAIRDLEPPEVFVVDAGLNLNRKAFTRLAEAEKHTRLFQQVEMSCELYATHLRDEDFEFLEGCRTRRVGVGLQSFNAAVNAAMGRPFDAERFIRGVSRLATVAPVTIEIILGLPGDNPVSFRDTVRRALALPGKNLHVFHCLVLPDGLMTRAPPGSDLLFDPFSLEMRSCRGWSELDMGRIRDELNEMVQRRGGRSHDGGWEIPMG